MSPVSPIVPSSKDDITLDWLNSVFKPQGYKIKSFQWKGTANNGHGVMSTMERVVLELESGDKLSIILKTLPTRDSPLRDITVGDGFAEREFKLYAELFPLWDGFLKSRNVPENFRFRRPTCYYAGSSGESRNKENYQQILILEDLFTSGFKMWPEGLGKGLGFAEAKPCIRLIALFHAVGLAYKNVNNIDYTMLFPALIHKTDHAEELVESFFKSGFDVIRRLLKEYGEKAENPTLNNNAENMSDLQLLHPMPPGLMEHLETLKDNGYKNLEFLDPSGNQVGTVLHNDLHVNNFMFPETSDESGVVLYDFQAVCYSMPTKDLSFFLIQNCDDTLLTSEFEMTIGYYHDELHKAMEAMGVSMDEYDVDWIREEYCSMAYLSMIHIIAGAAAVYTGNVTDDSKRRFYNKIVQMYNDGLLECVVYPKIET